MLFILYQKTDFFIENKDVKRRKERRENTTKRRRKIRDQEEKFEKLDLAIEVIRFVGKENLVKKLMKNNRKLKIRKDKDKI